LWTCRDRTSGLTRTNAAKVIPGRQASTPPPDALLYLTAVLAQAAWPGQVSTVAQVGYDPITGLPVSVIQLT
jgi:hypothetical protein